MNTITQQAKEYTNTNIEFFDSDGNPCVQPAFVAGANYVIDHLSKTIAVSEDGYLCDNVKKMMKQLKQQKYEKDYPINTSLEMAEEME